MDAITSANKRTKFAWAKYYEVANDNHRVASCSFSTIFQSEQSCGWPTSAWTHQGRVEEHGEGTEEEMGMPYLLRFYSGRTTIDYKLRSLLLRSLFRKMETYREQQQDGQRKWKCCVCNREYALSTTWITFLLTLYGLGLIEGWANIDCSS